MECPDDTFTVRSDDIQGGITADFIINDSFRIQVVMPAYNKGQQARNQQTTAPSKKGDSEFGKIFEKILEAGIQK